MRLAVSNIAWHAIEDEQVHRTLVDEGVDAIELAPTRLWPEPAEADEAEARDATRRVADEGLEIVSFQSLLFARPDLALFRDDAGRADLARYLARISRLAGIMGARRLVFGSPKSRAVPDGMSREAAFDTAVDFFAEVADVAASEGTMICIEPNPPAYSCNFVTTGEEGAALVRAVDSEGFGLHLDSAGLVLAGDDPASVAWATGDLVRHVHASAPQLGDLEGKIVDHFAFASALRGAGYSGLVSIEMRSRDAGTNATRVREAVRRARAAYAA